MIRKGSQMTTCYDTPTTAALNHTSRSFPLSARLARRVSFALLGLFLASGSSRPLDAQEEVFCGVCQTNLRDNNHWAAASWMPEGWYGAEDEEGAGDEGYHIDDNLDGTCTQVHDSCPGDTYAALTDAILDATRRSDVAALASLVNDPVVTVFAPRSAIQIMSCNPDLVGVHVPVDRELLYSVQVSLAGMADRTLAAVAPGPSR